MKPAVPSAVPYPDMRSWQRLGVKLRGQRSRRETGTPSREARRNLPARRRRGARDGWVRPTHVNVRESVVMSDKPNVLTGLNQKVCGMARSSFSGPSWTTLPPAHRTGPHHPEIHAEQGKPITLPATAGEPRGTLLVWWVEECGESECPAVMDGIRAATSPDAKAG
jgi:hypothetical protein